MTLSAVTTGATKVIFKSCLSAYDFNSYDSVKYSAISQASKGLFMTDNTNINFNYASEVYLNFINPTGTTKVIDVQMFNSAGALIDTRSSGFIPVGMLTMKVSATSLIALGFSPPVYQFKISMVWTIGILVPDEICVIHPIFPVEIKSGFTLSIFETFLFNSSPAI